MFIAIFFRAVVLSCLLALCSCSNADDKEDSFGKRGYNSTVFKIFIG